MFKKKEQPANVLIAPPQDYQSEDMVSQQYQQQPYQQQVQPPRRMNNKQARILKAEVSENQTFIYIVETNYPLALGDCSLEQ
jgi:hypothetical protein